MTYSQVWWPILGICALRLTHPKCTHTQQWTHTRSSGQPFMLRRPGSSWGFGALLKGTSVMVLRVERALDIHSPHLQFLPARDSNSQPLDYESDSLTIRRLMPHGSRGHIKIRWKDKKWIVSMDLVFASVCLMFESGLLCWNKWRCPKK